MGKGGATMKNDLHLKTQRLGIPKSLKIKSIPAFRNRLAQDTVNKVHAEQRRVAEMAEKELLKLLKLFNL